MAISRDSALLTTAGQVVDLTGAQDLANLEADSEFSVADTLLEAHRWVYDRLKRRFGSVDLPSLSNQTELHRAIAARFLEVVAASGHWGDADARDYWAGQAREEVDGFAAEFAAGIDEHRRADEGIPVVGNFDGGSAYPAGGRRPRHAEGYWGDLPTRN